AADQGPDPAADLVGRLQRDDDLRGDRPAAARVLRARPRAAPGRAVARRRRASARRIGAAATHHPAAAVRGRGRTRYQPPAPAHRAHPRWHREERMIRRLLAARELTKESIARAFSRVHFVGIGGAGMSGIAEVLCTLGYQVSGSDTADNATTQ